MVYNKIKKGIFLERPNRFIAYVQINGDKEICHVKNTGRCKELLIPGVTVILEEATNLNRKTKYDLIAVYKEGFGLINIDSQAPNKVAYEWLKHCGMTNIHPEYKYGNSRIDFFFEDKNNRCLMEVKGCTLEREKIGYFPDAPTERGVKHIYELIKAKKEGFRSVLAFVIQMEGVYEVRANVETHKEFGDALHQAEEAGVEVIFICCKVEEDGLFFLQE